MELEPCSLVVTVDGGDDSLLEYRVELEPTSETVVAAGPLEIELRSQPTGFRWSLANRADIATSARAVALVMRLGGVVGPLRIFRHGYQSWSSSSVATFGIDVDPSCRANLPFVQGVYHADARRARDGELRSEWCTALADESRPSGPTTVLGFEGGANHDGTFRLRRGPGGEAELWIEAFLGGAVLAPGERRDLHGVSIWHEDALASEMLARWAHDVARSNGARADAAFQVGWCSWYQFFDRVTEVDLRRNLSLAREWPFEVFQLDDGYQRAIGDWLQTNAKFPSPLDTLASDITASGMRPGLWLAPFLAAPDSDVARRHPEWIARASGKKDEPLRSWWNQNWGGGEGGMMYSLDTSHPEVLEHLAQLGHHLVEAGFSYLKLDFTFAASVEGGWHDPAMTPAQRVRAGFDAIRRGAGDDAFILGCGAPLANVVGVVDANRIGADVAPRWAPDPSEEMVAGYLDVEPATRAAFAATVARSFMHRSLWLNDPDCLMLRDRDTELSPAAVETWNQCVGVSGGLVLVSDDLDKIGNEARRRLEEVVRLGRASDGRARQGQPPVCSDLMEHPMPTSLRSGRSELMADMESATSVLRAG